MPDGPRGVLRGHRLGLVLALPLVLACSVDGAGKSRAPQDSTRVSARPIEDVLAQHTPRLMAIPGVVGTAQGEEAGRPCVVVYVTKMDAALRRAIPATLEGYPVRIQESGDVGPLR